MCFFVGGDSLVYKGLPFLVHLAEVHPELEELGDGFPSTGGLSGGHASHLTSLFLFMTRQHKHAAARNI